MLVDNIHRAMERIKECGNIFYGSTGFSAGSSVSKSSPVSKSYGSQVDTLKSILANLTKLGTSVDSILD